MKKLLLLGVFFALSGCVTFSGIDSDVPEEIPAVPVQKVSLYCPKCDIDDLSAYFINGSDKDNYTIEIESNSNYYSATGDTYNTADGWWRPLQVLNVLSVGIIPAYWGSYEYLVSGKLVNKKTGKTLPLGKIETATSAWEGWVFLPMMPFYPTWNTNEKELCEHEAAKVFLKRAATAIYEPSHPSNKWHCTEYYCHYNELMAQRKTSADDVLWVAENTSAYFEFQKAADKLEKPLETNDNCTATRNMLKRQILSKETKRYWALVDFYKENCSPAEEFGITKEQLINAKGIPSKSRKLNADTEYLAYSSLSEDVNVTTTIYTIDHGIVTKIESKTKK